MRDWRLWIGLVFSVSCLALALVGIDWPAVGAALSEAEWRFLLPASLLLLAFLIARSFRWRLLLGGRIALGTVFAATNIGYLVSNVLPFRLGDAARAVVVGLGGRVRTSAALSTVVVENVLDVLAVVVLLGATTPFVARVGWTRQVGLAAGSIGVAVFAVLAVIAARPRWALKAVQIAASRLPATRREQLLSVANGALEGLAPLSSARMVAGLVGLSAVTWSCSVGCYLALLRAFVPQPSIIQAAFLTSAIGLGMALPSAPGATGVFHSVARYALEIPFGLSSDKAISVAFSAHMFMYILMSALGMIGLAQQGLSLPKLRSHVMARTGKE